MHLFFHPDLSASLITVSPEESRHIAVLRLKPGDTIHLADGKGLLCKAIITDSNTKACQLQIMERYAAYGQKDYFLHIAIAPTKQMERMEWFLEKATEIGIDAITPVICRHAERREVKTERLHKIIQSAMKQSLKAKLPELHEAVSFRDFVSNNNSLKNYIACGQAGTEEHLKNMLMKGENSTVLIGPEGDFTEEEMKLAVNHHYKPVSLGTSRLRTETAGVMVCAFVSLLNS